MFVIVMLLTLLRIASYAGWETVRLLPVLTGVALVMGSFGLLEILMSLWFVWTCVF